MPIAVRRLLVLGREGMLGQMVTAVLSGSAALEVGSTTRRDRADRLYFDVSEAGGCERLLDAARPWDLVVNCLAVRRDQMVAARPETLADAVRVNARFPHELAGAARARGIRLVHVSTDAVFAPEAGVCDEETAPTPADDYGRSKRDGEVDAPGVLTVRCSIVGPDPLGHRGLLEWVRSRPPRTRLPGYAGHLWSGVTTLQFARMCRALVEEGLFDPAAAEGSIHHFCPNQTVTRHDLVATLAAAYRPDLAVDAVPGPVPPVRRVLATRRRTLRERFGTDRPLRSAIEELAARG